MRTCLVWIVSYAVSCAALMLGAATAQDVFADWYPQPVRFVLETSIDGEVVETATFWIGDRALRAEFPSLQLLLVDEDVPVLYYVDRDTGDVERMDEPQPGLVGTMLPFGSAAHPCNMDWPCTRVGEDTIDGRPVEVWEVEIPGIGATTAWVDEATRVQLRSRGVTEDGAEVTSEVVELEVGPQPDEMFVPPPQE